MIILRDHNTAAVDSVDPSPENMTVRMGWVQRIWLWHSAPSSK